MRNGRLIGYARVSTQDQDLALQLDALNQVNCTYIFKDKVSGAKADRPVLDECLRELQEGDTLIVWRIDRLGRSLENLVQIVADLKARGVGFKSITEGIIDTTSASGELVFGIFSVLAQYERRLIQERVQAGLDAARARGRLGGRRPVTVDDDKVKMVKMLSANKDLSIDSICKQLKISKATYYRYLAMGKSGEDCGGKNGNEGHDKDCSEGARSS